MRSPTTTGGSPMRALNTTMTASRPGKRTRARKAPKGTPTRAARSTAERLTMRDSRTIAMSAGSAVSTSWSAETSVGMKNIRPTLDLLQIARLWSNLHLGSYVCMPDLLTTDEAATYLRLSERKLYELVANGAVPCTKVTGKWLFPKAALDRWLAAGLLMPALAHAPAPPIVGGSHDPLLKWALRESGSGLASLPEGSEAGLRRLTRGEVMIAPSTDEFSIFARPPPGGLSLTPGQEAFHPMDAAGPDHCCTRPCAHEAPAAQGIRLGPASYRAWPTQAAISPAS